MWWVQYRRRANLSNLPGFEVPAPKLVGGNF